MMTKKREVQINNKADSLLTLREKNRQILCIFIQK